MKKYVFVSLALLLFTGCYKEYDLEDRYTLAVSVSNENGQALENVQVVVRDDYFFSSLHINPYSEDVMAKFQPGDYDNLISYTETNAMGEAILHFPRLKSSGGLDYLVLFSTEEGNRNPLNFVVRENDFENNYLAIPEVRLYSTSELVSLTITIDLDTGFSLENYSLEGEVAYNSLNMETINSTPIFTFSQNIRVRKNQLLTLRYILNTQSDNVPISIEEEVTIQVADENLTYVIQNP